MKLVNKAPNCQFVEEGNGVIYCFSYGENVAKIRDGKYTEFDGYMYHSRTSNRHKKMFREYYGV